MAMTGVNKKYIGQGAFEREIGHRNRNHPNLGLGKSLKKGLATDAALNAPKARFREEIERILDTFPEFAEKARKGFEKVDPGYEKSEDKELRLAEVAAAQKEVVDAILALMENSVAPGMVRRILTEMEGHI